MDWNRYAYVRYNPINATDPSGHETVLCDEECEKEKPKVLSLDEMAALYGVEFVGDGWTFDTMAAVLLGVDKVGTAFAKTIGSSISPASAFKSVYGNKFTFGWGSCSECKGAGGYTYSSTLIRFASLWTSFPERRVPNVIHELGHAFNNLFTTQFPNLSYKVRTLEYLLQSFQDSDPDFPDRPGSRPEYGYAGSFGYWQQSREYSASEEFADNFIGWTLNSWANNDDGRARSGWMNQFMDLFVNYAASH